MGGRGDWASSLASRGIKYILLAREVEWRQYAYLDQQAGLLQIADYGSIVVYRNLLVR
jgi:hypothetical protein